jgi:membrane fusion protein (multidrug efflux system)
MKSMYKFGFAAAVLVLLASCGGEKETKDAKGQLAKLKAEQKKLQAQIVELEAKAGPSKGSRKVPVYITPMSPTVFNNYIDVQGKVDVDEIVNAIPETPGIINAILVRPGQYVRKGQVVATLRAESVDKGIAELDQQIDFAKTLYDKQKRLWDQEIGTEIQLLSAKNQYESLLKKKQSVLTTKSSFNVYSPISGVVDAVDATVGQSYASPVNPPIIRIINTGKLQVKAEVAENYAGTVRTGSSVMLIFPDLNDTLLTKVSYAEKLINNVSRTYSTYIPLPASTKYQPNMLAKVKIATYQNPRAFVLPASLIQKTDQGNFVYVADANRKAKLIPVQVGNTYDSKVEILSGLSLGEQVITTGYEELNEGDELLVEETK